MLNHQILNFLGNLLVTAPNYYTKGTKVPKTYSGQIVPMIGYATITFRYDSDGQFIFPLTVWITEMRTQILLGIDFCHKQVSGIHFDLPGIEIKNPPKSICYGSFHQNKSYTHSSQILTVRTPYTMYIDAKSARCWKYSITDTHIHFPPGSTFQPNRTAVATGLSFVNTLCTRPECNLPIFMKKKQESSDNAAKRDVLGSLLSTCLIKTNPNTKYEVLMS